MMTRYNLLCPLLFAFHHHASLGHSQANTNITSADCASIMVPNDPSGLPMFLVRYQGGHASEHELGQCVVECDGIRNGTHFRTCYYFSDPVTSGFRDKGLYPSGGASGGCLKTIIDAPDEAPGSEDPEMTITSCPEWLMWQGWDRGALRKLENMRTQVALKSIEAIEVFKGIVHPELRNINQTLPADLGPQLLKAAKDGDLANLTSLLVQGAPVDFQGYHKKTALMLAESNGHVDCLWALIIQGKANLDVQDDQGYTAAMWASTFDHLAMLQALIEGGANLDLESRIGSDPAGSWRTAVMMASDPPDETLPCSVRCLKALIEAKADLNVKIADYLNATARTLASQNHRDGCWKLLKDAGAIDSFDYNAFRDATSGF